MKRRRISDVICLLAATTVPNLVIYVLMCLSAAVPESSSQDFPFSPPVVLVERNWRIPEDEPVGTKVAHARTPDEHTNTEFSLEPNDFKDGSQYFRIDKETGAIYLNKSVEGQKGEQYYLQVVGYNGHISAKTTVWIHIIPSRKEGSNPFHGVPTKPEFPPSVTPKPGSILPTPPPTLTPRPDDSDFAEPNVPASKAPATVAPKTKPPSNSGETQTYNPLGGVGSQESPEVTSNEIHDPGERNSTLVAGVVPVDKESANSGDHTTTILIVVPAVLIFGIIPIIVAAIWFYRRKHKLIKRPTKEIRKESAATSHSSVALSGEGGTGAEATSALAQWIGKRAQSNRYESWNPDDPAAQNRWEFPRHHLQIGGILGEGCFGQVWRCEALNIDGKEGTTTVAVKTLKESAGERERLDLISELTVMKMLDTHPNVVRLLGCCTEKEPIFVIMEFVALGKLQSYLRNSRASHYYGNLHADSTSLSSKDLTAFGYQVARGMEYLASKGIIHRDLAARNVLIDKERTCKVADFGFTRDVVVNHVYERKTDGRLPIRWMAPEALYDNIFTTKTDVWSFGVLLWEIVTLGSTPYPGMAAGEVMRKVRDGYRLDKPEHCRRELYNIMFYCWAHNPDDRPTFTDLVNFLRHLLFSEADYIDLDKFPDHDYYNMPSLSGEKL